MSSGDFALVFETQAPIAFRARAAGVPKPSVGNWLAANLRVFQACDLLDERPATDRGEVDPVVALELRRLDLKMTLMLELMAELLAASTGGVAERAEVALDARGVRWSPCSKGLAAGQEGVLELYIHPNVPRPLKFFGSIVSVDAEKSVARFEFGALAELESDQLERLIFRHHRRKVADARGLKSGV